MSLKLSTYVIADRSEQMQTKLFMLWSLALLDETCWAAVVVAVGTAEA